MLHVPVMVAPFGCTFLSCREENRGRAPRLAHFLRLLLPYFLLRLTYRFKGSSDKLKGQLGKTFDIVSLFGTIDFASVCVGAFANGERQFTWPHEDHRGI